MSLLTKAGDLVYTFRFLKLLVQKWEDTDAFKLGLIDKNGKRIKSKGLNTSEERGAYTTFHRLVYNIKRLLEKIPGGSSRLGTYAAALFLLKDTFKESVDDPDVFEKEFMKYLKEQGYELDDTIMEEVVGFGEVLPKGEYTLVNDILNKEEEELTAKAGDKVVAYDDEPPIDTVLGVEIFPIVHVKTQEKIYVSLEDIK